jgi:phytoene desaturase
VVVVGAGPGGLAAAALLAKAGIRVTVLERLPHIGGRTSTFVHNGFRFDRGPTFFHYPQVLEKIFASLGYNLWHELNLVRLDPMYRLVFGSGGEIRATSVFRKMEAAIAALNASDAAKFQRFLLDNRRKMDCFRPFLESPFNTWRDIFRSNILRLLPTLKPWRSLDQELKRYFADPRVRLAFSFQSKYLGMSPQQCPSLFTILAFLEYEYGIYHPIGGCGAITMALARIARQLGASIHINEPVVEICFEKRRAVAVRTAVAQYKANAIVLNSDFAHTMKRFVPDRLRRRWRDEQLAKKSMSCSAFMLYIGLRGIYDHLPHHTIYVAKNYNKNMNEIGSSHMLSTDPSFYVQNACITDSTLAPEGKSTLYVMVPVTHKSPKVNWESERSRYRDLILNKLAELGAPDIHSRIECEQLFTPADWETHFELYKGALFGLSHIWSQMLHLRPHNRFEELDRVYLVGSNTHPGSGLPVIFQSAQISSQLLLEDLGVPIPWKNTPPQHEYMEVAV